MNLSNINDDEKNIDNGICDLSNELVSLKNPTKIHEIIVKIVNLILILPFFISILFVIIFLLIALFSFVFFPGITISGLLKMFKYGKLEALLFVSISLIGTIVFNVVMCKLMVKKNKIIPYKGKYKKIKKKSYVEYAFFLGIFGIHRFKIEDKKGGIIRLVTTCIFLLMILFLNNIFAFNETLWSMMFEVGWIGIFLNHSLAVSDFVIGLSKVSDENKMISM